MTRGDARPQEGQTKSDLEGLTLKQLEEKGVVLSSLTIWERRQGLGGRTLITLARDRALTSKENAKHGGKGDGQALLPAHRFSAGDIVCLRDQSTPGAPLPPLPHAPLCCTRGGCQRMCSHVSLPPSQATCTDHSSSPAPAGNPTQPRDDDARGLVYRVLETAVVVAVDAEAADDIGECKARATAAPGRCMQLASWLHAACCMLHAV